MTKNTILIILFCMLDDTVNVQAQLKLGNHPSWKNESALLELESPSQGLLLTRVADTNAINALNPPDGMIIYFTDGATSEPYGLKSGIYERENGHWHKPGIILDTAVDKSQTAIKFTREDGIYVLHLPNATTGLRGVVSGGRQTFSGRKTFKDSVVIKNLHGGSIVFVRDAPDKNKDILADNNDNLFWDNTQFRLGVGTHTPDANLDVNGNFKLGENGSKLNDVIRDSMKTEGDSMMMQGKGVLYSFSLPTVEAGANVVVSPASALPDGIVIAYGYTATGVVYIKVQNSGTSSVTLLEGTKFNVVIIQ